MKVTAIFAIKEHWNLTDFSPLHLFVATIFLATHCYYTSYLICHIIPHIYVTILLYFHQFLKTNRNPSLQENTWRVVEVT